MCKSQSLGPSAQVCQGQPDKHSPKQKEVFEGISRDVLHARRKCCSKFQKKQYRSHGLSHIDFFFYLAELRVRQMNGAMLRLHKESLIDKSHEVLRDNRDLKKWDDIFTSEDLQNKKIIKKLN